MKPPAEGAQPDFDTADVEPFMGRIQADEQRLVIIGAAVQIVAQMQLGPGVEVDRALLGTLAEHDQFLYEVAGLQRLGALLGQHSRRKRGSGCAESKHAQRFQPGARRGAVHLCW